MNSANVPVHCTELQYTIVIALETCNTVQFSVA